MTAAMELDKIPLSPVSSEGHFCADKDGFCPGCCDMCTGKCNFKKVLCSLTIAVFTFLTLLLVGEAAGLQTWSMFLVMLGISDCGWLMSFSDKKVICVEVPPKVVSDDDTRRLSFLRGHRNLFSTPSAEEQSMSFTCSDTAEDADACAKYCNADHIWIRQVFLVEDEDDDRGSWSGYHIRVVVDEKVKNYMFDYSLGCKDEEDYLAQDFSLNTFQCGYSEIGYDLYHNVPTSGCAAAGANCESKQIKGETYYYATMSNLVFGPDLQKSIRDVKEGRVKPGVVTYPYPKSYDHIVDGCTATYKVDFSIPEDYTNVTVSR